MDFNKAKLTEYEKPWIINLELTNACNLECIFCDHSHLKKNMRIGDIDDSLLEKIFKDIRRLSNGNKIYELGLVGLGEPTLDRRLKTHIALVNTNADYFERISFNSNLVSFNKETTEILLKSRINVYTFSVNASNRHTYIELMRKNKFDRVMKNFKFFLQALKTNGLEPRVDVQIIEADGNHLEELKTHFEGTESKINFFVRKVYSKPGINDKEGKLRVHAPKKGKRYPCWDIYTRIYIDVEGYAYPCTIGNDCYRQKSDFCLGNVKNHTYLDLFNNDISREARQRSENGFPPFPQCENCNIWSLTPNNFFWDTNTKTWKKKKKQVRAYGLKG